MGFGGVGVIGGTLCGGKHCLYHWSPTQSPGEQQPLTSFVQSPHRAIQLVCSPSGSQVLSPSVPHERHCDSVSPHQEESQFLKFCEQQPFSVGVEGDGGLVIELVGDVTVGDGVIGDGDVGVGGVGFADVILTLIKK